MDGASKPQLHDRAFELLTSIVSSRHIGGPLQSVRPHYLDQLTPEEIRQVSAACKQHAERLGLPALRFNAITLQEPPKQLQLQYEAGQLRSLPRKAYVVLELPSQHTVVTAFVGLDGTPAVESWEGAQGVQAMVSPDDTLLAEQLVLEDPKVQQLLRQRYGVRDMSLVVADPWYYGLRHAEPHAKPGRYMQCYMYLRSSPQDNHYAHPLDLIVNLELDSRTVLDCLMHDKVPKTPAMNSNFTTALARKERPWRTGLKPLNIIQPQGPSFTVEGNHVRWQKWDFRVSFNYREGLVFHHLGYEDQGRVRPIMHRMSLVEVIVPYGDPRSPFQTKAAYDSLDYGMGYCANSLELGCDCLGHIRYFDGVWSDSKGEPVVAKKVVCMHEEDHGLLWKHVEYRDGRSDSRRNRRLNLNFVATVANYEYLFLTYLYQDGSIQYEVKLTGCLSTNGLSAGEGPQPTHGTLLAPGLNAQIHQHFFCVRMDMAVDDPNGGRNLSVVEVNVESDPEGPDNLYGVGFSAKETALGSELQARRRVNADSSRVWKVVNYASRNVVTGAPVAFKLVPSASPPMYALPTSSHATRGIFATKNLWVTPHSDEENYPAGLHPLQQQGTAGLAEWTAQDRNLKDADAVIWHSFGVTHIPRIEDWPVMPVEQTGFWLKPVNFYDANPSLDIPPERNAASKEVVLVHSTPGRALTVNRTSAQEPAGSCNQCSGSAASTAGPQPAQSKL